MGFNIALKTAILEEELTQTVVAKRAGMYEPRLSRIIRGYDEPRDDEKKALAKVLNRKVVDIFPYEAA